MKLTPSSTPLDRSHKPHKQRSDRLPEGERKERRTLTRQRYKRSKQAARPFVAFDGEGYTDADGEHHYALFGNSLGDGVSGKRLTYHHVFPVILRTPPESVCVIFAGNYDAIMMFKGTPQIHAIMRGGWVRLDPYRVRYLRGKYLIVKDMRTKETRTLYDVFSFFGTSFVKACRKYLPAEYADTINDVERMKAQRSSFTTMTDEICSYMNTELELLVLLASTLRGRLEAVDIHITAWHGPGAIANAVLRRERVKDHLPQTESTELAKAAEAAYYGGRFEMVKRGTYLGAVYQYDIRSAYPNAMRHLPSLAPLTWTHRRNTTVTQAYALYRVDHQWSHLHETTPHRSTGGRIYYPLWSNGWYWGVELQPGTPALEAWEPKGMDTADKPFSFIPAMYADRARLKAEGQPQEWALKLALNSLYGKVAQSKGAQWDGKRWRKPTYHQMLWAGFITAHTRSLIQNAMRQAGDSLIAIETDAVFTTKPLDLPLGTDLGLWDETVYDGIRYIQSGIHATQKDGDWSYKSRGFTLAKGSDDMWNDLLAKHQIAVQQTRFITDPRWSTFARWVTQSRRINLDGAIEKRINGGPCSDCLTAPGERVDYTNHLHRLVPYPVMRGPSTPYQFVWRQDSDMYEYDLLSFNYNQT